MEGAMPDKPKGIVVKRQSKAKVTQQDEAQTVAGGETVVSGSASSGAGPVSRLCFPNSCCVLCILHNRGAAWPWRYDRRFEGGGAVPSSGPPNSEHALLNAAHTLPNPLLPHHFRHALIGTEGGTDALSALTTSSVELPLLCSSAAKNRFIVAADAKNFAASPYHIRSPETRTLKLLFCDFLKCVSTWKEHSLMLKTVAASWSDCKNPPDFNFDLGSDFAACIQPLIARFRDFQAVVGWGPAVRLQMEIGTANALLPSAYQCCDQLLMQVTGRRRVLLLHPGHSFKGLYPYPVHHPYDGYSQTDLERPNFEQWPLLEGVYDGIACTLEPGDALLVPRFWWMTTQLLDEHNCTLVGRMQSGRRIRDKRSVPLQVSRFIEDWVAAQVGPSSVRSWLMSLALGEIWDRLKLNTVKGYNLAKIMEEVTQEMERAGYHSSSEREDLLLAMCRGRLLPTPWLNEGGLTKLLVMEVSEEEFRYPELFRQQLIWREEESRNKMLEGSKTKRIALK